MNFQTAATIKTIFSYLYATAETIARSIAESFLIVIESFQEPDNRIYKAEFGDSSELYSSWNNGFCLGAESISLKDSYQNMLVQGSTGTGKGVNIIIPSILKMNGSSLIIHDPSGENALKTSGYLRKKGYQVRIINFSKPEQSDSFNPLDYVSNEADINKLATLLVRSTMKSQHGDQFWTLQSITLLKIFISIVLTQEKKFRNLANIKALVNSFSGEAKKIDALFAKYATESLFKEYKAFIGYDQKVISGVTATVNAALQLFNDPDVCRATSISTIDFDEIRRTPTVIYIQNSTSDANYYTPLISAFFELIMTRLMSKLPDKELNTFLIIDEASTLTLESLSTVLANCRKYRVGILTAWQSHEQLIHSYGVANAETIRNNSLTRCYLTGQGIQTSQELEKILGRTEIVDDEGKKTVKPLLLSEEIRTMQPTDAIVISGSKKPFKISMVPYYKQPFLNMKTKIPPVECINPHVKGEVPLISLK